MTPPLDGRERARDSVQSNPRGSPQPLELRGFAMTRGTVMASALYGQPLQRVNRHLAGLQVGVLEAAAEQVAFVQDQGGYLLGEPAGDDEDRLLIYPGAP